MSNWPIKTIAECADDEPYATQIGPFGKALTPEAYQPTGVPLLRGVNVNHGRLHDDDFVLVGEADADRLSTFESFPGDVLLVRKGTLGKIGLITTAEMIARPIDLAKHLREAQKHGEVLGLSSEETAFYDALAENGSARDVMKSDTLRLMARELTEMVKKMPKLDWTERESVRASLRRNVRRLLAKYGYPPDLAEGATQLVLRQAELSTGNSE